MITLSGTFVAAKTRYPHEEGEDALSARRGRRRAIRTKRAKTRYPHEEGEDALSARRGRRRAIRTKRAKTRYPHEEGEDALSARSGRRRAIRTKWAKTRYPHEVGEDALSARSGRRRAIRTKRVNHAIKQSASAFSTYIVGRRMLQRHTRAARDAPGATHDSLGYRLIGANGAGVIRLFLWPIKYPASPVFCR